MKKTAVSMLIIVTVLFSAFSVSGFAEERDGKSEKSDRYGCIDSERGEDLNR